MVIPAGSLRALNVPSSVIEDAAVGFSMSVILIIWIPSSTKDVTRAYVDSPTVTVVNRLAPSSSSKVSLPSLSPSDIEVTAVGETGSVISIIWMPLSSEAVTRAYVDKPILTVVTPRGPSSVSKVSPLPSVSPSDIEATAVGAAGLDISIICIPSSVKAVTRAYIEKSIWTMLISIGPSSVSKVPPLPSVSSLVIEVTAVGFLMSVISIIWMPLSLLAVTRAYVD